MKDRFAVSMFGQKRLSREGGIEIVVKELCTRMARDGCETDLVHCFSDSGILLLYVRLWLDLWVTAKEKLSSRFSVQKAFEHYCSLCDSRNRLDRTGNYRGGQTPTRAIAEVFTIRYIQPLWFIWVIIAVYIVFYAVFNHTEINVGAYWFAVITIAYILISAFVILEILCGVIAYTAVNLVMKNTLIFEIVNKVKGKISHVYC